MIIGISGKKQHGKDTVADIIQYLTSPLDTSKTTFQEFKTHFGKKRGFESHWEKKQFASKLKQIVCLLIGCDMKQLEDNTFKEAPLGEEWECYIIPNDTPYPDLFPIDSDIEWLSKGRKWYRRVMTPRMLLQLIGTECGRQIIHPNIWVNATMADYKFAAGYQTTDTKLYVGDVSMPMPELDKDRRVFPNWIITDCRFPNEAEAIKKRDGIIIRVNRPGMPEGDNHPSETSLDDYKGFDWVLRNNSNLTDLTLKVKTILEHFNILK